MLPEVRAGAGQCVSRDLAVWDPNPRFETGVAHEAGPFSSVGPNACTKLQSSGNMCHLVAQHFLEEARRSGQQEFRDTNLPLARPAPPQRDPHSRARFNLNVRRKVR